MNTEEKNKYIHPLYVNDVSYLACHPSAPTGGGGCGAFSLPGSLGLCSYDVYSRLPHPYSPAGRYLTPAEILWQADSGEGFLRSQNISPSPQKEQTVLDWNEVKADFERWEGRYSHMYLDTVGLVTVGIGKMLPTVIAAQKLGFVKRVDGSAATAKEIETDFNEVKKQPAAKLAKSYKKHTHLDLPDKEIDTLLKDTASGFEKSLEDYYKDYASYPTPVKRALLDMVYNLGIGSDATKKHSATGLHQYKTLKAAVESGDWKKASVNCHRKGPSEERNNWTRDLFLEAVKTK
jgi:GH24 family phage-related lysozyme (muramidase)